MNHKLLLLFTASSIGLMAQNSISITKSQYDILKANKQLDLTKNYLFTDAVAPAGPILKYKGENKTPSSICSCTVPLDTTFSYVPFVNYIGTANGNVYGPNNMNDDASSIPLTLPFTFNFYGVNHNTVYINNNGNISFTSPYSTFTANPFPSGGFNMIAPFWGDVDTRDFSGTYGANTFYKITPTAMIVKWENVGYYDLHFDKLNTFQLIITNGADTLLPPGMNVGFCYGDMQWTTGDVTGGGGFGSPATVGVNQGNGTDYFQVGTFAQPGVAFDGPYNGTDGVSWLDNQGMYFNTAVTGNIPPIVINNNICDTIDVYTGDTIRTMAIDSVLFDLGVSTPEINQNVTASFTCSEPSAFSYTEIMNTPTYKKYSCKFIAQNLPIGLYYVTLTATDDGTPVQQTVHTVVIRSNYDPGIPLDISENSLQEIQVYPNPNTGVFNVRHNFNTNNTATLILTDILGNTIMNTSVNQQTQSVDINNFPKGIYFLTITSKEGKSKTIKVVHK